MHYLARLRAPVLRHAATDRSVREIDAILGLNLLKARTFQLALQENSNLLKNMLLRSDLATQGRASIGITSEFTYSSRKERSMNFHFCAPRAMESSY